jgi:hypothetical protein
MTLSSFKFTIGVFASVIPAQAGIQVAHNSELNQDMNRRCAHNYRHTIRTLNDRQL